MADMACPNGSVPLLLPWTNNSVSSTSPTFSRGVSFAIGTPPQLFSLTPSTVTNNLFIDNAAECGSATNSSCIGQLGGIYASATSTSFAEVDYAKWTGSRASVDTVSGSSYIFFNDVAAFGPNNATNKFPAFPMYTNGSTDSECSTEEMRSTALTYHSHCGRFLEQRSNLSSNTASGNGLQLFELPGRLRSGFVPDVWPMGWIRIRRNAPRRLTRSWWLSQKPS